MSKYTIESHDSDNGLIHVALGKDGYATAMCFEPARLRRKSAKKAAATFTDRGGTERPIEDPEDSEG